MSERIISLILFSIEPTQTIKLKRTDETSLPTAKKSHNMKRKKASQINDKEDELDFVRVKPKDQIPILTFWATIDPHFRPLEEADRELLLEKVLFLNTYI